MKKIIPADIVKVMNGGNNYGTWMHEDVAIEFARWLSPTFAIWCNDRIKELIKFGITATPPTLDGLLSDPESAIKIFTALKVERERNKQLEACNSDSVKKLQEQAPKVLFADSVTASKDSILIRELAVILKQRGISIGEKRLFEWLRKNKYLCSKGESHNQPTQRSMELGLFEIKKFAINQPDGNVRIKVTTKVLPKGQVYFISKFLNAA